MVKEKKRHTETVRKGRGEGEGAGAAAGAGAGGKLDHWKENGKGRTGKHSYAVTKSSELRQQSLEELIVQNLPNSKKFEISTDALIKLSVKIKKILKISSVSTRNL